MNRFMRVLFLVAVIKVSLIVRVVCWSSVSSSSSLVSTFDYPHNIYRTNTICNSLEKCTKHHRQQVPLLCRNSGNPPRKRITKNIQSSTSLFGVMTKRKAAISATTMGRNDTDTDDEEVKQIIVSPQSSNWRVYDNSATTTTDKNKFPFDHDYDDNYNNTCWSDKGYNDALDLYDSLMKCDDPYLAQPIKEALDCLDGAYRLYGPSYIIGSYNGGKDAVVILHLMRAAHANYYNSTSTTVTIQTEGRGSSGNNDHNHSHRLRPRVLFFDHPDEFPEIITLLEETVLQYDLDMIQFTNTSFREGLRILVDNPTRKQLAFVLGTRTSDPNSQSQGHFSPSSSYMPPFMRINPIFHWSYGQIWHFLRLFQLPYCYLYDQGYTSLGTVKDTLPCPALRRDSDDGSGKHYYMPAYMLHDWDQERAGRINTSSPATSCSTTPKVGPNPTEQEPPPSLLVCDYSLNNSSSLQHQQQQKDDSTTTITTEKSHNKTHVSTTNSTTTNELVGGQGSCKTIVGLLIIGDEILKGLCSDSNIFSAANALRSNGLLLSKVVIVSDEQEDIVNEIQRLEKEVDVIITSGGVGATHDDVTIRSVSLALNSPLVYHKELGEFIKKRNNINGTEQEQLTPGQIKMATLPKVSKLRFLSGPNEWPTLQCRNIYVLPGVPRFFKAKVDALASYLIKSATIERSETYKVVLSVDENSIVELLNEIVCRHPYVSIGSYPFFENSNYKTIVTIEGKEGPPLFPGETRVTLRKRSESLFIYHQQQNATTSSIVGIIDGKRSNSSSFLSAGISSSATTTLSSPMYGLFTKEEMDLNVRMALDDLISVLPDGSVLQVDNHDFLN